MAFDKYFSSSWKRNASAGQKQRALHRARWPSGTQYKPGEETIKLWMRESGREWFHVRNIALKESQKELAAWRHNNPGWEFRLVAKSE